MYIHYIIINNHKMMIIVHIYKNWLFFSVFLLFIYTFCYRIINVRNNNNVIINYCWHWIQGMTKWCTRYVKKIWNMGQQLLRLPAALCLPSFFIFFFVSITRSFFFNSGITRANNEQANDKTIRFSGIYLFYVFNK